ncbi:MAG TPA: radical SAM protein, partial [Fibrobacteraceae bacterium]|nr:radical SAM protein [Fibrobacteraceae bacterium]
MIRSTLGLLDSSFRKATGQRALPRILTWALTFRCNARCSMCDSWKKDSPEMDTESALRLIARLPLSLSMVRLTGGEPFLREDLGTLVEALRGHLHPEMLHLTTNGFLTRRIIQFMETRNARQPLHLLLSLDGQESLHNRLRGQPWAYERCLQTLNVLVENRKKWNFHLAVNQTIVDEEGIDDYPKLHALL